MHTKENIEQAKILIAQFIKTPNDYSKVKSLEEKFSLSSFVAQQCKRHSIEYNNLTKRLITCRVIDEQHISANKIYKQLMLI